MPKIWEEYEEIRNDETITYRRQRIICGTCRNAGDERYSLGLFAGYYCNSCWDKCGMRKEGVEGFHPDDAGESYEAD